MILLSKIVVCIPVKCHQFNVLQWVYYSWWVYCSHYKLCQLISPECVFRALSNPVKLRRSSCEGLSRDNNSFVNTKINIFATIKILFKFISYFLIRNILSWIYFFGNPQYRFECHGFMWRVLFKRISKVQKFFLSYFFKMLPVKNIEVFNWTISFNYFITKKQSLANAKHHQKSFFICSLFIKNRADLTRLLPATSILAVLGRIYRH